MELDGDSHFNFVNVHLTYFFENDFLLPTFEHVEIELFFKKNQLTFITKNLMIQCIQGKNVLSFAQILEGIAIFHPLHIYHGCHLFDVPSSIV